MGDQSQPKFLKQALHDFEFFKSNSPKLALNTGSLSTNFGSDYSFLDDCNTKIDGCDLQPGAGVDYVFDLTKRIPNELHNKYDLIISSSTLEHVTEPWNAAKNLELVTKPNGFIYISVPWIWRYHAYPNDYWRFNQHTLDVIFKNSTGIQQAWSTSPDCKLHDCLDNFDDLHHRMLSQFPKQRFLRRVKSLFSRSAIPPKQEVKYLPYLMIHQLRRVTKSDNSEVW